MQKFTYIGWRLFFFKNKNKNIFIIIISILEHIDWKKSESCFYKYFFQKI